MFASCFRKPSVKSAALVVVLGLFSLGSPTFAQRRSSAPARAGSSSLVITSEPKAIVWIDEIRRGATDANGRLEVKKIPPGRHNVRVRAVGYKEATTALVAGRKTLAVKLIRTTDQAELLFQRAEEAREKARDDAARQQSLNLYAEALTLRPSFPAAHVGLARVLLDLNQYQKALSEIEAARRGRPVYPEASAVEGRIHNEAAFTDEAIESYRRAIREAKGVQPEAHVGLARVFEEQGKYAEAEAAYRKAIAQLSDSEPVIYQLLGAAYEKQQKFKEAVAVYEKYLELAPNGSLAPALRSIIEQLRRDAAGQEIIP